MSTTDNPDDRCNEASSGHAPMRHDSRRGDPRKERLITLSAQVSAAFLALIGLWISLCTLFVVGVYPGQWFLALAYLSVGLAFLVASIKLFRRVRAADPQWTPRGVDEPPMIVPTTASPCATSARSWSAGVGFVLIPLILTYVVAFFVLGPGSSTFK